MAFFNSNKVFSCKILACIRREAAARYFLLGLATDYRSLDFHFIVQATQNSVHHVENKKPVFILSITVVTMKMDSLFPKPMDS